MSALLARKQLCSRIDPAFRALYATIPPPIRAEGARPQKPPHFGFQRLRGAEATF